MNVVFMGTPDFAVPSLKALIDNFSVSAVFTQPDRPKGRGKKITFSTIKQMALDNNIPVYQPEKIKNNTDMYEVLKNIVPDFIVVVAFGQILPKEILDIPKYACINLHASLLPKYRGAAPINWCIINGEKESGNTTMLMDVGLDKGDMLLKSTFEITEQMTAGELHDLLKEDGAGLLVRTLNGLVNDEIIPEKQDHEKTCYAPPLDKSLARIDWNNSAEKIYNLMRGLNPNLIAMTNYKGNNVKIFEASILNSKNGKAPGTIISVTKEGITVSTETKDIILKVIQFPNGKPLKVEEFIKGNTLEVGTLLHYDEVNNE